MVNKIMTYSSFLTFLKAIAHGDREKDNSSFEPEIYYYMVPAGLDIIFQDEDGTEITRWAIISRLELPKDVLNVFVEWVRT